MNSRYAAAMVVMGGLALGACGADGSAEPEPTGTNFDEFLTIADAYNDDDAAGVLEFFAEGTNVFGLGPAGEDSTTAHLVTIMTTVGDTVVMGPCESGPTELTADCRASFFDDFHGAAGVTLTATEHYTFDENGKIVNISATLDPAGGSYGAMERAMSEWLLSTYPETHAQVAALEYWDDERWVIMLEHVDEFIAASEKYPLPSE